MRIAALLLVFVLGCGQAIIPKKAWDPMFKGNLSIEELNRRANNPQLSDEDRCKAIFGLFTNYCHYGQTEAELKKVFTDLRWLKQAKLSLRVIGTGSNDGGHCLTLFANHETRDPWWYISFGENTGIFETAAEHRADVRIYYSLAPKIIKPGVVLKHLVLHIPISFDEGFREEGLGKDGYQVFDNSLLRKLLDQYGGKNDRGHAAKKMMESNEPYIRKFGLYLAWHYDTVLILKRDLQFDGVDASKKLFLEAVQAFSISNYIDRYHKGGWYHYLEREGLEKLRSFAEKNGIDPQIKKSALTYMNWLKEYCEGRQGKELEEEPEGKDISSAPPQP